jgi:hypothetical protein
VARKLSQQKLFTVGREGDLHGGSIARRIRVR